MGQPRPGNATLPSGRTETIGGLDRLLLLLVIDAEIEVLERRILQSGAAGKHVPFGCLNRIRPGTECLNIEMRNLVLRHDITALCCAIEPAEAFVEITLATKSVDQPDTEIDLCSVCLLYTSPSPRDS